MQCVIALDVVRSPRALTAGYETDVRDLSPPVYS